LATIQWARGDFDAAEATRRKEIELDPESPEPYAALAMTILNRLAMGIDPYRGSIIAPAQRLQIEPWINSGQSAPPRFDEMDGLIRKATQLAPQSAWSYKNIACYYFISGQLELAHEILTKARELDPDPVNIADCYSDAASSLAQWGVHLDEALELAQKSVQLSPSTAGFIDTLALVYFQRGEFRQTEQALRSCIELGDTAYQPERWYRLGRVYERQNKPGDAITAYEKALSLRPDYLDALNALQQLQH
jgi:tetratricopeptide (TPR) repeat protein